MLVQLFWRKVVRLVLGVCNQPAHTVSFLFFFFFRHQLGHCSCRAEHQALLQSMVAFACASVHLLVT